MKPENEQPDTRLVAQAKQVLERSLADLHPDTCSRLRLARRRALEEGGGPSDRFPIASLRWAGGFAMASLAVLAVALWMGRSGAPNPNPLPPLEDLELVTSGENFELSEDLDFYGWLAETATAG
ncbi:MAG: hypothetical protein AB1555_11835 [Nitrospirota bacterium]